MATVHWNESKRALVCSQHVSLHHCPHKDALDGFVLDATGGWVDLYAETGSHCTADISSAVGTYSSKKNLKCVSSTPVPVPLCYRTKYDDAEDAKYDKCPSLVSREVPTELKYVDK